MAQQNAARFSWLLPSLRNVYMFAAVCLCLVEPACAKKKKDDDMLAHFPAIFKFCMFWWCIFVFVVMIVYIVDLFISRRVGPAKVVWSVEHTFRGGAKREDYWAQFVDLTKWSTTRHPVLLSADVRMVKVDDSLQPRVKTDEEEKEEKNTKLTPLEPGVMKSGYGFILRHKANCGTSAAGLFYCTRKCLEIEKPQKGPWRYTTQTIEVGAGYPFEPGSERIELQLFPPADDGSIRCEMSSTAAVTSRIFRWWQRLDSASKDGALAFLEAIGKEVEHAKKKD